MKGLHHEGKTVFTQIQFSQIQQALRRDSVLRTLISRYPPLYFESFYEKTSILFPNQPTLPQEEAVFLYQTELMNVHDLLFQSFRAKAKTWLKRLPSSMNQYSFSKDKLISRHYRMTLLSWYHERQELASKEKKRQSLVEYIHFVFDKYEQDIYTGVDILVYAMQWCDSIEDHKKDRRAILELALLDSMNAYEYDKKKFFGNHDYSCMPGLAERILDVIGKIKESLDQCSEDDPEIKRRSYVDLLTASFFKEDSKLPSQLFYSLYLKARTSDYSIIEQEHNVIALNPLITAAQISWIERFFIQEELQAIQENFQKLQTVLHHDYMTRAALLGSLKPYLETQEDGSLKEDYALKRQKDLIDLLKNEFYYRIELHCNQPYPGEHDKKSSFFQRNTSLFTSKTVLQARVFYEKDYGVDHLFLSKMATLSGLTVEHIQTLLALLNGDGLSIFHSLFEDDYADCLPWDLAQSHLSHLRNKLLDLGKQILLEQRNYFFGYMSADRKLKSMIAHQWQHCFDNIEPLAPDHIMAGCIKLLNPQQRKQLARKCVYHGFDQTLDALLSLDPKIHPDEIQSFSQESLLITAVNLGHRDIIEVLLNHHAQMNVTTQESLTPFRLAIQKDLIEIVELFLIAGINPNLATHLNLYTDFHFACELGNPAIVELLIRYHADHTALTLYGDTPFSIAVSQGFKDVVELFFDYNLELESLFNRKGYSPHRLLTFRAYKGQAVSPCHIAAQRGYVDIIKVFLQYYNIIERCDQFGWTALHFASRSGQAKTVEFLIDSGFDLNRFDENGDAPIHIAAVFGHQEVIEIFLNKGVDIHLLNQKGQHVLHLALLFGHQDLTMFLIEYEPSLMQMLTADGENTFHCAVRSKSLALIQCLLDKRVDYTACTYHGNHALHLAIEYDCVDMFEFLLNLGLAIDAQNIDGATPLHLALEKKQIQIIKKLLERHPSLHLCNKEGKRPCDIASEYNISKHIKMMLQPTHAPILLHSQHKKNVGPKNHLTF